MIKTRIIPVLLWDDRGLCKPIQFQRPGRHIGSLMSAALLYEKRICDELVLLDIDATPKGRGPRFEEIKQFTSKVFCPLTVGGGIKTCEDIRGLLNAGADKVVIGAQNSNPFFLKEASEKFGAQCITAALDVGFNELSLARVAAVLVEAFGCGEILLTSKEQDGTRTGYDLNMIRTVCKDVRIPVIANGGCNHPENMLAALHAGAHAVAASSMFLYDNITPRDCKVYLHQHGVPVRMET